jgi:hypothetical protein
MQGRALALVNLKTDPLIDSLRREPRFPGDRAGVEVSRLSGNAKRLQFTPHATDL